MEKIGTDGLTTTQRVDLTGKETLNGLPVYAQDEMEHSALINQRAETSLKHFEAGQIRSAMQTRTVPLEPHGTITEGRLKGCRAAKVCDVEDLPIRVLVRPFDCADPSFGPDRPIQIPLSAWDQDKE